MPYGIHPDPPQLRRYGIAVQQLMNAVSNSNANIGGDYMTHGHTVQVVRGIGLIGGGQDPLQQVVGMTDPKAAAAVLRAEEKRRIKEIRQIVVASVNNVPIRVEDLVDGGPVRLDQELGQRGVVVGHFDAPRPGEHEPAGHRCEGPRRLERR